MIGPPFSSNGNSVLVTYHFVRDGAPGGQVAVQSLGTSTGLEANFNGSLTGTPVAPWWVSVNAGNQSLHDDGYGLLVGDGYGTVDYVTGEIWAGFSIAPPVGVNVFVRYYYRAD